MKVAIRSINLLKYQLIITIQFLLPILSFSQKSEVCNKAWMIVKTAEKHHFNPRPIDNKYSELVFSTFLNQLDPNGIYFTNEEIKQLEVFKLSIDDEILEKKSTFLSTVLNLYKINLQNTEILLNSFKTKIFDFNKGDSINLTKDALYLNHHQFVQNWEKLIKLQVLYSYYSNLDSLSVENSKLSNKLNEIKDIIIQREICKINSKYIFNKGLEEYIENCFLKSVALAFDPHTNYYTDSEEQAFFNSLSKEVDSFGLILSRNDYGEIEISHIIPGSPAWSSNVLNNGDIILNATTLKKHIDFNCIPTDEVVKLFNSNEIQQADFVFRKKSGKQIKLKLHKEKIEVDENLIKSFLLKGRENVGYIYLPSFYSQGENNDFLNTGCANDLAKEIVKLKRENIDGLIVDLRGNSGGSMKEAILMSGIFLDYSAICIIQTRKEAPIVIKDFNRGTIYDGPLVVLIDHFTASAAELFATAMKDLNRAVIVGTKSYGKSTVQEVIPIDAFKYDKLDNYNGKPLNYLKITSGAYFRLTGDSHQNMGVIPDIVFPSIYNNIEIGEAAYQSSLDLTPVDKKANYTPLPFLPIQELNIMFEARAKNDSIFKAIKRINKYILEKQDQYSIPLNKELFKNYFNADINNSMPIIQKPSFDVKNIFISDNISSLNEISKEINERIIKQIEEDVFINEAFNVINDLINLNQK